nr:unnamed protein product [Callosobruchus chinensis]
MLRFLTVVLLVTSALLPVFKRILFLQADLYNSAALQAC